MSHTHTHTHTHTEHNNKTANAQTTSLHDKKIHNTVSLKQSQAASLI